MISPILMINQALLITQQQISSHKNLMNSATPTASIPPIFSIIDSGPHSDNSCVFLPLHLMEQQGLKQGDLVHITCPKRRKETLALLFLRENGAETGVIRMNHICRKNLAAEVGDSVKVEIFKQAVELQKVVVKKIGGFASTATPENHEQNQLTKYFSEGLRPICRDDLFQIKTQHGTMEFMISCTQPSIYGFVTPNTMIAIDWSSEQLCKLS